MYKQIVSDEPWQASVSSYGDDVLLDHGGDRSFAAYRWGEVLQLRDALNEHIAEVESSREAAKPKIPTKPGAVIQFNSGNRRVVFRGNDGRWARKNTFTTWDDARIQESADENGFTVLYEGADR